jgi:uncharacterized protein with ParB-like and HNH nuclease domain
VIDGQQRLTTVSLLLTALADVLSELTDLTARFTAAAKALDTARAALTAR